MVENNPYQPPQAPINPLPPAHLVGQYAPCPYCQNHGADLMKFTWWGGVVGPKILTHVKCRQCGKTFNGKTGRPNTAAIWAYQVVTVVACGILAFLFFKALR